MKSKILVAVLLISGCSNSAYESGWNSDKSSQTFRECSLAGLNKNIFIDQNVDRLVPLGLLDQQEAEKAKRHEVSVGEKECAVYAAYGMWPAKYKFTSNTKKQLITKEITYLCDQSPIACPGYNFVITDGRVSSINRVVNQY